MRAPASVCLVVAATACAPPPPIAGSAVGDLYWIESTETVAACSGIRITSNFVEAEPAVQPPLGRREESLSMAGSWALVTRSADGAVFVNHLGVVLPGSEGPGGTIEVGWTNEEIRESSTIADPYTFSRYAERRIERTMTLSPTSDDPLGGYEGTMTVVETFRLALEETDEWSEGFEGFTQMEEVGDYLVLASGSGSSVRNFRTDPDCSADICELEVVDDCARDFTVSASFVDGGVEVYELLEDYRQDAGGL